MKYLIVHSHNNWNDIDDGLFSVNTKKEAERIVKKLEKLGLLTVFVERD